MKRKIIGYIVHIAITLSLLPLAAYATEDFNSYTPYELTASQMEVDGLHPYGSVLLTFKINNLLGDTKDSALTWYVGIEKKIGNRERTEVSIVPSVIYLDEYQKSPGVFTFEKIWKEDYNWDGTSTVSYRVYVSLEDLVINKSGKSRFSNEASIDLILVALISVYFSEEIAYNMIFYNLISKLSHFLP